MDFTNDEWLIVNDLEGLINSSRALVFNNFGKKNTDKNQDELSFIIDQSDKKEFDKTLSFDESKPIVENLLKKQYNKKKDKTRYLLNNNIFMEIIAQLNDRMVSNILNNLVNKGLIETAYDEEANDFVFWVKNENLGENNE